MRTNKFLVLSCLLLLFAIPASLSVFAFFYHTDYTHQKAVYFANNAIDKSGLTPSPTIFHFQPEVMTAKQREQLANAAIPTETAKQSNGENIALAKNETTVLAAKIEEQAPTLTQPTPTPVETKVKDVAPTPTVFIPQPTSTTQPKSVASDSVKASSAVVVETPASSIIIEQSTTIAQPTTVTGLQQSKESQVCGEGEFC